MFIAPFKAIRPQPHKMKSWIKRQIGTLYQNTNVLDFLTLIQQSQTISPKSESDCMHFLGKKCWFKIQIQVYTCLKFNLVVVIGWDLLAVSKPEN